VLRWLGERNTVVYGHVFDVFAFAALAFVTSGALALVLTPLAALGAVITPALQAMMSKMVGDDQQGELQGILTSIYALAMVVSPLMMTSVFAAFTREGTAYYLPGAPFLLSIVLILIGLAVFVRNPPPQG